MAIQDILNNSQFGSQYLLGDDTYSEQQTDALGNNLSPTPTQGGIPTVDPQNDLRSPLDYKQDRIQANFDTLAAQDTEGKHVGRDGFVFDTASETRKSQLQTGLIAFGMSFLAGENTGQSLMRAGQATYAHSQMIKRGELIPDLIKKGYASVDIQKYYETGNPGDLIVNKGKTTPLGDGVHTVNTLTGEIQTIGTPTEKLTKVDLGDRIAFVNPQGQEVHSMDKGETPDQQSKDDFNVLTGSSTGEGVQTKADENGNTYYWQTFKSGGGKWTPISATNQKRLNEQESASVPTANQQLVNDDLTVAKEATDEQLKKITGNFVGRSDVARDVASSSDPEVRKIYNSYQRLGVQLGNAAIAGAKDAGASGINTEAELKRFTAGVPQPDYTSVANLKASRQKMEDYAESFKAELLRSKGVKKTAAATPSAAPKGGKDFGGLW